MSENNSLVTNFAFKGSLKQLAKYNLHMLSAVKLIQKFAGVQDEGVDQLEKQIMATEEANQVQADYNAQMLEGADDQSKLNAEQKESSKSATVLGSAMAGLGKKMKKYKPVFKGTSKAVKGIGGAAMKATTGLYALAAGVTAAGMAKLNKEAETARFSKRNKIDYGRLKQLDAMAQQLGESEGSASAMLSSIQGSIGDAELEGSELFARLGLSARDATGKIKPAMQLFEETREAFGTRLGDLSEGSKQNLASQLGISGGLYDLLVMSNQEYSEMLKRNESLLDLTNKDRDASININNKLAEAKAKLSEVGQRMSTAMAPTITKVIDGLTKFLDKYAPVMESMAVSLAETFNDMNSAISPFLDKVIEIATIYFPKIWKYMQDFGGWLAKWGGKFARVVGGFLNDTADDILENAKREENKEGLEKFKYGTTEEEVEKNKRKANTYQNREKMQKVEKSQAPKDKTTYLNFEKRPNVNNTINQDIKMEISGTDAQAIASATVNKLQQSPNRLRSGMVSAVKEFLKWVN